MESISVKVIIATHKRYRMPEDKIYLPLHVGATLSDENFGYQKDNTGENISDLNKGYCELTGLYWAWKNLDEDYIGLAHYRRHFAKTKKAKFENILTFEELKADLGKIRVFVPTKRRYYIETLYSHYAHTHRIEDLDKTKEIIEEKYPDYTENFDKVVGKRSGYMFNMMIMQKELLSDYCTWLFDILFELEKRIDSKEFSVFDSRFYGRVSEIIFNVWLDKKISEGSIKKDEIKELPHIHLEKINWWNKGTAFLKAKFLGKKYEKSF